jgi:hypothetical protein
MDSYTQNHEVLMKFLDGEMDPEEKNEFERKLESDTTLRNELENLQAATDAIRLFGLKQQVSSVHKEMIGELQPKTVVRKISSARTITRYTLSIAAGILLIFIGVQAYRFINLSSEKLYSQKFNEYELPVMRDTKNPAGSPIEQSFREKKYSIVVSLFASTPQPVIQEKFLAGISFLELNKPSEAIKLFHDVLEHDQARSTPLYKDETEFYLALALLKNKNYKSASELMTAIHNDPKHLYHNQFTSRYIRDVHMLKWK